MDNDFLFDNEFLIKLNEYPHKVKYAKIIALTLDEKPVEEIQGKVTGGSINIDGASAMRRTCSLSLVATDVTITNFYWGLTNKFKVEIGLENHIDERYDDILWFKQGTYAITSFSVSQNATNTNISISGKDKMCYLNGEISGNFFQTTKLNKETFTKHVNHTLEITERDISIPNIITEMLSKYGNEPKRNIILNDLPESGLEMLEYRGEENKPLSVLSYNDVLKQADFYDDKMQYYENGIFKESSLHNPDFIKWYTNQSEHPVKIWDIPEQGKKKKEFKVEQFGFGEAVGYRLTDLIYPNELIAKAGDTVVSVLDKIKNLLGDFEYFYDLEGKFIFQKKKTYINTAWSPIRTFKDNSQIKKDYFVEPLATVSKYSYCFSNQNLLSAVSYSPALQNVKNDFCVWGTRQGISGASIPIHMRYAIHQKPTRYTNIVLEENSIDMQELIQLWKNANYTQAEIEEMAEKEKEKKQQTFTSEEYDWREIMYQMAKDYYAYNHLENFYLLVEQNNPEYINGVTQYEQYYEDMLGFWREIYNPDYETEFVKGKSPDAEFVVFKDQLTALLTNESGCMICKREEDDKNDHDKEKKRVCEKICPRCGKHHTDCTCTYLFSLKEPKTMKKFRQEGKASEPLSLALKKEFYADFYNDCYQQPLSDEEIKIIASETENVFNSRLSSQLQDISLREEQYYNFTTHSATDDKAGWTIKRVDELNFWIDFLDSENSEISQFSIPAIGSRPKVINDSKVKAISYREVPNIIYYTTDEQNLKESFNEAQYSFVRVQLNAKNLFSISARGKSAKTVIDNLVYQHAFGTEGINLTTVPIYYLEPNTRIQVMNANTLINSDYIIDKITLPLTFNGTMSISAKKAIDRLY